jgi:hypothetical protein
MIYPEPEQGKRSTSVKITHVGISKEYLSHARTVLKYAPELAANVLSGALALDKAYQTRSSQKEFRHGTVCRD